jgi:hypothetical protein
MEHRSCCDHARHGTAETDGTSGTRGTGAARAYEKTGAPRHSPLNRSIRASLPRNWSCVRWGHGDSEVTVTDEVAAD